MSEWGNPPSLGNQLAVSADEFIVRMEPTQGTETSQYLEERKSTETPSVAASESGLAQTNLRVGVVEAERSYKGSAS